MRHERVLARLPQNWQAANQLVSEDRRLSDAQDVHRTNDVMARHLATWSDHELITLIAHTAAAAQAKSGQRKAELGKPVSGWASKANEVLLIQRILGGQLASGQQEGLDGTIRLPDGRQIDVNAKLVTKYKLQDNFSKEDVAQLIKVRQQRGDEPGDPPPFGRIALVLHPHTPQSEKNGLYFMPDYGQGAYGTDSKRTRWKSVRLADVAELEQAIQSGKLVEFRRQVLSRLQKAIDWEELKEDMVRSEINKKLATAETMDALITHAEQLSGSQAAELIARKCIESVEANKFGKIAIANSQTVKEIKSKY